MFDINTFSKLAVAALPAAALITGLTEVVKRTLRLPGRFVPLAAVILGAIIGYLLVQASGLGILVGLAVGLASVGLFEVGKTTVAGVGSEETEKGY